MEENISVKIKGLGKKYLIGDFEKYLALRDILVKVLKLPVNILKGKKFKKKKEFWALKDINLEINQGDVVGIIGRNGAGKSTLLKILSRITDPTEGEIEYKGRVSSLLEVGTGFHPELTGRENIYLNGAILGMSKKEINKKLNDIIEFSGIRDFIDMPVKKYSSGMQVRLAFSVAAHLDSDILIIDEVLAVGDAEFQKKCLGKMDEVTKTKGRTVFFVSHDLGAIQRLCKKTVLLEEGKMVMFDETGKVIESYLSKMIDNSKFNIVSTGVDDVIFRNFTIKNSKEQITNQIPYNEGFQLEIDYEVKKSRSGLQMSHIFESILGTRVFSASSSDFGVLLDENVGLHKMVYKFPQTKEQYLSPGMYMFKFGIGFPNKKSISLADNIIINIIEPRELVIQQKSRKTDMIVVNGEWKKIS